MLSPSQHALEDVLVPLSTDLEVPMVAMEQLASVVFGGAFGSLCYEPFTERFTSPRARGVVLTSALLDLAAQAVQRGSF